MASCVDLLVSCVTCMIWFPFVNVDVYSDMVSLSNFHVLEYDFSIDYA